MNLIIPVHFEDNICVTMSHQDELCFFIEIWINMESHTYSAVSAGWLWKADITLMPYEYKCKFLALTRGKIVFMSGGHDIMLREANVKLALSLTKNHFHFSAKKTLFDKFQKYVIRDHGFFLWHGPTPDQASKCWDRWVAVAMHNTW